MYNKFKLLIFYSCHFLQALPVQRMLHIKVRKCLSRTFYTKYCLHKGDSFLLDALMKEVLMKITLENQTWPSLTLRQKGGGCRVRLTFGRNVAANSMIKRYDQNNVKAKCCPSPHTPRETTSSSRIYLAITRPK